MKKIALKLIEFGMDFEYEHHGSQGEKIICYQLGLEVSHQNGNIYYSCGSDGEKIEETELNYDRIVSLINQECINETSSF